MKKLRVRGDYWSWWVVYKWWWSESDSDPDLSHSQVHTSPILPDCLSKVVKSYKYMPHSFRIRLAFFSVHCEFSRADGFFLFRKGKLELMTWPNSTPSKADPRSGFQFVECESKLSPPLWTKLCKSNYYPTNASLLFCRGFLQVMDCLQYQYKWMN